MNIKVIERWMIGGIGKVVEFESVSEGKIVNGDYYKSPNGAKCLIRELMNNDGTNIGILEYVHPVKFPANIRIDLGSYPDFKINDILTPCSPVSTPK